MTSLKERAELAGNRYEELKSFEADQEINTGRLSIKSHVKFKKPRKLVVEYDQYRNPFEDFEIQVSGGPEFSGDDLSEARLVYDGRFTWVHLINKDAVYKKEGKRLGSPFTGVDVFGQLGFLPDLVSDFLLKDEGEGEVNGRPVDRIGIKPKDSRRSLFLKDEVFNLDKAELAIDKEIGLPLKITYYPGQEEQIRFPASQGGPVYVEYSNYEVDDLAGQDFSLTLQSWIKCLRRAWSRRKNSRINSRYRFLSTPSRKKGTSWLRMKYRSTWIEVKKRDLVH